MRFVVYYVCIVARVEVSRSNMYICIFTACVAHNCYNPSRHIFCAHGR